MMKGIAVSVAIALVASIQTAAFAHPGGTDHLGCHTNTATGVDHCHGVQDDEPVDEREGWTTLGIVFGTLGVLFGIGLLIEDGDPALTLRLVPGVMDASALGLALEYPLGAAQHAGLRLTPPRSDEARNDAYLGAYFRLGF